MLNSDLTTEALTLVAELTAIRPARSYKQHMG